MAKSKKSGKQPCRTTEKLIAATALISLIKEIIELIKDLIE